MRAIAFRHAYVLFLTVALAPPLTARSVAAEVPTPESHFGFRMGTDGRLAAATDIERYFERVGAQSDRVKVIDIGPTTEGHRTIAAIISAAENIRNLDEIRADNQRLADPRALSPEDARGMAATHKAVLVIGCSIHASEIGATQAANELLYWLATSADPQTVNILQQVVIILIPSLNPDGYRFVVDWYQKTKRTGFAGAPMPWMYHKYAGHDINRDAFMMNLVESRNLARFFYEQWHPQVFLSMHEMGADGPRMFVPPISDPIGPNYDPLLWREAALLGGAMALELQRDRHPGVVSNAPYDYYWPGYEDSAPLGHNTVCLLTEVASAKITAPANASTNERRADLKNRPGETPQIGNPDPWRGGLWTLRDVIDYDVSAVHGLLYAVAAYREPIVQNFYEMGRKAIELGGRGGPFAFIIPPEQHDLHAAARLEELLLQGGIEIHRALEPFRADGDAYPAGSDIILLAQPHRAYVKTLLEHQEYPGRRLSAGGPPDSPYDATGWTLPAQMGIDVRTIERTFEPPAMARVTTAAITPARIWGDPKPGYYVIDARGNGGAIAINRLTAAGIGTSWVSSEIEVNGYKYAPGSLVVASSKVSRPIVENIASGLGLRADGVKRKLPVAVRPIGTARVAVYRPWLDNSDEGWTRWLLDRYEFRFKSIDDYAVRAGNLRGQYDVIILPSAAPEQLMSGNASGTAPAEYVGGLGEPGVAALKSFVEAGGTLVCLDRAGGLAIDRFKLPLRDIARDSEAKELFGPGSILRIDLDPLQPGSYGMTPHTAGFFAFSSAYDGPGAAAAGEARSDGPSASAIQVVARYAAKDLLLSGWLEGGQIIAGRAAAVEVGLGAGRIVLLGFPAQHRGQSHATFRLLFNSIFTAK